MQFGDLIFTRKVRHHPGADSSTWMEFGVPGRHKNRVFFQLLFLGVVGPSDKSTRINERLNSLGWWSEDQLKEILTAKQWEAVRKKLEKIP